MSTDISPQLRASGGRRRKHTCSWRPQDATMGEGCPRLTQCLQELHPSGPCALIRFHLRSDGGATLPFATANYEDVQFLPYETVRQDAHTVFPLLHPEDFDRVTISMTQAAREIRPWLSEYRILHPQTGKLHWLRTCLVPHRGTQDDLVGYGLQADVTAEKQLHAAVLDLCRRTSVGVFRTTMQGRYLSVNQQFANICGYDSPETSSAPASTSPPSSTCTRASARCSSTCSRPTAPYNAMPWRRAPKAAAAAGFRSTCAW
jgi:PAS fold.